MHICISKLTIIGSDNGLSPVWCQVIIWTNAAILSMWPWRTYFSEILFQIEKFSFMEMHCKMSSAKWQPFCLGLNVFKWLDMKYFSPILYFFPCCDEFSCQVCDFSSKPRLRNNMLLGCSECWALFQQDVYACLSFQFMFSTSWNLSINIFITSLI